MPDAGTVVGAPATLALRADATDSDGTVAKVDFFEGTTLIGTATTAPWTTTWSGVPAGTYSLTATATDDQGGASPSAPVSIVVDAPPTVSLTSPAGGVTFLAPVDLSLTASAADSDGTVSRVEFYSGTTLLGTSMTSPWSFAWNAVPAGTYSLTARAIDDLGIGTDSSPVIVTVSTPVPTLYFIHTDNLNTPHRVSNSSQSTVWTREQREPFGDDTPNEDPDGNSVPFVLNLRFAGQYFDEETGTSYNYFRDYDARLGRYLQADPIGAMGGLNLYTYVENSPMQFVDTTGLSRLAADCKALRALIEFEGRHGKLATLIEYSTPTDRMKATDLNHAYDSIYGPADIDWMLTMAPTALAGPVATVASYGLVNLGYRSARAIFSKETWAGSFAGWTGGNQTGGITAATAWVNEGKSLATIFAPALEKCAGKCE